MDNASILVVDDESDIRFLIKYILEKEGYRVMDAENGQQALELVSGVVPDLILLDVMMPEMNGIETCKRMKSDPRLANTLICFLTALGEDENEIEAFDAGADDYIVKPIKPKVLISRIRAVLKRGHYSATADAIPNSQRIWINHEKYVVVKNGKEIFLPRKEFELLAMLMSKPGKVFQRDEILSRIWGMDVIVGDRTIDVHIRKLRKKLGKNFIETIKGVGYKFVYAEQDE